MARSTASDDLEAHRGGIIQITQLEPSDERIQDFGAIVVVSVRMDMRGSFQGGAFAGPFRYTRIWRAGDNGWRVVAGHVSAIANASQAIVVLSSSRLRANERDSRTLRRPACGLRFGGGERVEACR
jgi:hypothetical protein